MTLKLRDGVSAADTDYGIALLDEDSGQYWNLNPTGALALRDFQLTPQRRIVTQPAPPPVVVAPPPPVTAQPQRTAPTRPASGRSSTGRRKKRSRIRRLPAGRGCSAQPRTSSQVGCSGTVSGFALSGR